MQLARTTRRWLHALLCATRRRSWLADARGGIKVYDDHMSVRPNMGFCIRIRYASPEPDFDPTRDSERRRRGCH
ncbi:uncharacterized protein LY79DRAFT_567721, partial [Colletotrichum navitas]